MPKRIKAATRKGGGKFVFILKLYLCLRHKQGVQFFYKRRIERQEYFIKL